MAAKRGGYQEFVRRLSKRWDVPYDTALMFYSDLIQEMREMLAALEPIRFQGFGALHTTVVRRKWGRVMAFYSCPICDTGVKATPLHVRKHGLSFEEFCAKYGQPHRGPAKVRPYLVTAFRLYASEHKRTISSSPLKELLEEEEETLSDVKPVDRESPHIG